MKQHTRAAKVHCPHALSLQSACVCVQMSKQLPTNVPLQMRTLCWGYWLKGIYGRSVSGHKSLTLSRRRRSAAGSAVDS